MKDMERIQNDRVLQGGGASLFRSDSRWEHVGTSLLNLIGYTPAI